MAFLFGRYNPETDLRFVLFVVYSINQELLKDGLESSSKISKLFSVNKFAKTAIKSFVALPNRHQPSQSRVDIEHWLKANTA